MQNGVYTSSIVASGGAVGGGKGGKGKGSTPKEDPNSLRSSAYANILYMLCEGEIQGPATGNILTSLYLNDTVVQRPDGTANFQNLTVNWVAGTQTQGYIPGFGEIESSTAVGVKVTANGGPVTRTMVDVNANAAVVTLSTPQLQNVDDKGNIRGHYIDFNIQISYNGGAYINYVSDSFRGKCTSNYQRSYVIQLEYPGPYTIRVIKSSPDSDSNLIQGDLFWQDFSSRIYAKLNYPNTAMMGLTVSADQFKDIPKVAVLLKGTKIRIPNNYDPINRIYYGSWDGTFYYGWSDNPAWILYDLLTSPRYGTGRNLNVNNVDKWSLYTIGQYCDQLVPNGQGGFEPRFKLNALITTQSSAYDLINNIASVFRGMIYWAAGAVFSTQDSPGQPVRLYTEANVCQEVDDQGNVTKPTFVYNGTSQKARHTVALVEYADPQDQYKTKIEYVEDRDGLLRYGYKEIKVSAFGCTSRSQAARLGKWVLYTELQETETISFSVGSEGLLSRPGELINVADPLRAGSRIGGRILGSTGLSSITLDSPVTIAPGILYELQIVNPDGVMVRANVTNTAGSHTVITTTGYAVAPVLGAVWVLSSTTLKPQLYRVVSASENGDGTYSILAMMSNQSKYNAVESGLKLDTIPITNLPNYNETPLPPTNLVVSETLYVANPGGVQVRVNIGFAASPSVGIERYQVEYKLFDDLGDYKILGSTSDLNFSWENAVSGIFIFRIQSVNKLGLVSDYQQIQGEILGLNAAPPDVVNFSVTPLNDQIFLNWDPATSLAVQYGGYYQIKFSSTTGIGVSWSNSFDLIQVGGSNSSAYVPLYDGTYLIKAFSSTGKECVNASIAVTNYGSIQSLNLIQVFQESPAFVGSKNNTQIVSGNLQLTDLTFFDSQPGLWDARGSTIDSISQNFDSTFGSFDSYAGLFDAAVSFYPVVNSGSYEFSQILNLGDVFTSRVTASMVANIVNQTANFDLMSGFIDDATGIFDGQDNTDGRATLQISTSQDAITYSPWQDFVVGDYRAEAFKFRVLLESFSNSVNVLVSQLRVSVDMPDRLESGKVTSSVGGPLVVNYPAAFRTLPNLGITLEAAATGDYFELSNQTLDSFSVVVRNAAGTNIARSLHWYAKGFGKKIVI